MNIQYEQLHFYWSSKRKSMLKGEKETYLCSLQLELISVIYYTAKCYQACH
jgi:hypothetical protein